MPNVVAGMAIVADVKPLVLNHDVRCDGTVLLMEWPLLHKVKIFIQLEFQDVNQNLILNLWQMVFGSVLIEGWTINLSMYIH